MLQIPNIGSRCHGKTIIHWNRIFPALPDETLTEYMGVNLKF